MAAPSISEVLPNTLFVGNIAAAESVKDLRERNITHVLSVTTEKVRQYPNYFKYLTLEVYDDYSQQIQDLFEQAHVFIDSAVADGGAALVHCSAGVSRSAAFAISYVMKKLSMRLKQAIQFVRSRRKYTNPNFNFLSQLVQYEKRLFPDASQPNYVVEHVRSIWPEYTERLSDNSILRILEVSRYNHIEILYHLKKESANAGVLSPPSDTRFAIVVSPLAEGSEGNHST